MSIPAVLTDISSQNNLNELLGEDGVEYYFGIDGNGLQAKSLYLGSDEALLYWEDHRLGVISDLTYGQKVFSGWEEIQEPNGLKLSNNSYQTNPKAAIVVIT